MALANLTPVPSLRVAPPRIDEAAVAFEMKLRHSYDVKNADGQHTATLLVGEVVMFHVAEAALERDAKGGDPTVSMDALRPLARLGGNRYGCVTHAFDLPRPQAPPGARR